VADSTMWWVLAGAAVAVELVTGSLYLLMLAFGFAAGAAAAYLGAPLPSQLITAALVGGGGVIAWHLQRRSRPSRPKANADPDVNLDIGETVHVEAWNADGTANVRYRGANWTVVAAPGTSHGTGAHRVREVVGSRLLVEKL
jgi:membrane protein implicated in regulation of membrane protease activity